MTTNRSLGLDELMIVNPGEDREARYLLGSDGTLYEIRGLGESEAGTSLRFLLGDDGTLYEVIPMMSRP